MLTCRRTEVKTSKPLLVIMLIVPTVSMNQCQAPMLAVLCGNGLFMEEVSFSPSTCSSVMLLMKASNGVNGNATTNSVTNPYCTTISL